MSKIIVHKSSLFKSSVSLSSYCLLHNNKGNIQQHYQFSNKQVHYYHTNHNRTFSSNTNNDNNNTITSSSSNININNNNIINNQQQQQQQRNYSTITPRIKYLHKDYRKSNSINESHNTFDIEYNKIRQSILLNENNNSNQLNQLNNNLNSSNQLNSNQLNSNSNSNSNSNIILLSEGYSLGKAYKYEKEGDDEKLYGGEDAFFIQDNNILTFKNNPYGVNYKNSIQSIGVADGVGGWSDIGHDASLISRQLMQNCFFYSLFNGNLFLKNSKLLIEKSFNDIKEKKQVIAGSTTCCVITLYENELNIANIGDSGYLILRFNLNLKKYEILLKSFPQQHYHNAPYQLSIIPQYLKGKFEDSPSDAIISNIKIQNNDLIILASDGLFDNLYDVDILNFINQNYIQMNEFQLAKHLVLKARNIAFGFEYKESTPFQDQSEKNGFYYLGGKPDDITVVISRVKELF